MLAGRFAVDVWCWPFTGWGVLCTVKTSLKMALYTSRNM